MRIRGLVRLRHGQSRLVAVAVLALCVIIYCYYCTNNSSTNTITPVSDERRSSNLVRGWSGESRASPHSLHSNSLASKEHECAKLNASEADIDTVSVFPSLDVVPSWMRSKEYWDASFEARYEKYINDTSRPKLKVILVPHSHNDPGWLMTFEGYFSAKTKDIIDIAIAKMAQHANMTFMWTEIAFLNAWWESSHPTKQKALKKLIEEGRIEITTGGWVMADEATTHIYSLLDQLIEGHSWVKSTLGVTPKTGWSIDPFGHGATMPYLLDRAGFQGAIIQRIHYAWKRWFAEHQSGDFRWIPGWSSDRKTEMVVHNQPFDIYSIKGSCGPHPSVCLSFDFRIVPNEYTETTDRHEDITDKNVHSKSKLLMEEYNRIGSLTKHNLVLVPLGDDFRYEQEVEWDSQYLNYHKLFTYINSHPEVFNADVRFGTPLDYFDELRRREPNLPSLKGDFFVYSEIFSEGTPAYWSGYYTTRPYLKILARQLEHNLRSAEILFAVVMNHVKQKRPPETTSDFRELKRIEKYFDQLTSARRNMALFQHHDAITGTSKNFVMADYGAKLFSSLYNSMRIQETALSMLMVEEPVERNLLQSETQWDTYGRQPEKIKIVVGDERKVVVFNSLNEERTEVVSVVSDTSAVRVRDEARGEYVLHQVNPHVESRKDGRHLLLADSFDVLFVATLPPLAALTFTLERDPRPATDADADDETRPRTTIFCTNCNTSRWSDDALRRRFALTDMMPGDIQLENEVMKIVINRQTGFMKHVYRKDTRRRHALGLEIGAYESAQRHSGAYLFQPNYDTPEKSVLDEYANWETMPDEFIMIVSGKVATEITTLYLPFLMHTVRIFNLDDPLLSEAIYIENAVDFGPPPSNRETELFMRLHTGVQNEEPPAMYTDQNGFQYQRRVKSKLGIEANYYPITTTAWIQDEATRVSLLTDHAQGAAAFEPGRLELMLDRRMLYDDHRGMGEGVVDNKPTTFQNWLLVESMAGAREPREYEVPSQAATSLGRRMNYPVHALAADEGVRVRAGRSLQVGDGVPRGVHVVTLRAQADPVFEALPSASCLLVLHRAPVACRAPPPRPRPRAPRPAPDPHPLRLALRNITRVSLTGLHTLGALDSLRDVTVDPMEINTYLLTF